MITHPCTDDSVNGIDHCIKALKIPEKRKKPAEPGEGRERNGNEG